jgi:hypothetical protein
VKKYRSPQPFLQQGQTSTISRASRSGELTHANAQPAQQVAISEMNAFRRKINFVAIARDYNGRWHARCNVASNWNYPSGLPPTLTQDSQPHSGQFHPDTTKVKIS